MKIMILGAGGQVGADLVRQLAVTSHEVFALTRKDLDFSADLAQALLGLPTPDVLINCVAYNRVDDAEDAIDKSFKINGFALRELAMHCQKNNILLIHFSTDYVFGNSHQIPITELVATHPLSVYGTSKAVGDFFVSSYCSRHFIFRVSSVFGAFGSGGKGGNFVETMIRLASQNRQISIINDQYMSPTHSMDIAKVVVSFLENPKRKYGIYNCTSRHFCTWFEFASQIFENLNYEVDTKAVTAKEFSSKALRPSYSVLDNSKLNTYYEMPTWKVALKDYLRLKGHM